MKKALKPYTIELVLLTGGAVAAFLEQVLVKETDTALLIFFFSVSLSFAVLALRQEIENHLKGVLEDQRLLQRIPDPRWRDEARDRLDQVRVEFDSWSTGTRRIAEENSLSFQIAALKKAADFVDAVHISTSPDSLSMWDDETRGYNRFVDTYERLPASIAKRRIIVFDSSDPSLFQERGTQRILVNAVAVRVVKRQISPVADGGLGFDVRIVWRNPGEAARLDNLLIIDGREVCSIRERNGSYGDLEVTINEMSVKARQREFEQLWAEADEAINCVEGRN